MIALLFFGLGFLNIGRDLFGLLNGEWQYAGDLVDTRFNNLILEHNYGYITGDQAYLFSPRFFFPASNVLAGSDAHFSTTPFYVLFRQLGCDMFTAFQWWLFVLLLLNFTIAFWVLKKLRLNNWVVGLGAFLFTFSLVVAGQSFHIQTMSKFAVPLVFYFAYKWLQQPSLTLFIGFCFSFVVLFYSSLYFTLLIVFPLLVMAVFWFFYHYKTSFKRSKYLPLNYKLTGKYLGIAVIAILLCYPVAAKYIQNSQHIPPVDKNMIVQRLPVMLSYVTANPGSYLWGGISASWLHKLPDPWMSNYSLGGGSLILFLTSTLLLVRKEKIVFFFFMAFIITLLVFTAYGVSSPYKLLCKLPGFDHMNAPWRYYLVAFFLMIVIMMIGLNGLINKTGKFKMLAVAVMFFIVGENILRVNSMKHTSLITAQNAHKGLERLVNESRKVNHQAFVVLPGNQAEVSFETTLSAMWVAYTTGLPCINGYTTMGPEGFCLDWLKPNREQVQRWLQFKNWTVNEIEEKVLYIDLPKDL